MTDISECHCDAVVRELRHIPWEKRAVADPLKEKAADIIAALRNRLTEAEAAESALAKVQAVAQ